MRKSLAFLAAACVLSAALAVSAGPEVEAAGDGGATSRVTRDGRIITTILFPERGGTRRRGSGSAVTWLTLTDAEIAYLFQLAVASPGPGILPLLQALEPFLAQGLSPDVDVQVELRGGVPTWRARVIPASIEPSRALARQMVTVLPMLPVRVSPPPSEPVPVGQPVFFSFSAEDFATAIDRSLTAGGVTARVRARPVGFQVRSGDPTAVGKAVTCNGPGRPFDPSSPASPMRQARAEGTCAVIYRTVTETAGRWDAWYGDVTVLWRAEWTTDGTNWAPLGDIPRLTLFRREVAEARTAVERTAGATRG